MDLEKIDKNMKKNTSENISLKWHCPMGSPFRLSGFYWISKDKVYRRLPVNSVYKIPENVSELANHTAGGQVSFCTNSRKLVLKAELLGNAYMDHMAATGQCGFDCYIGEPGEQKYYGTTRFDLQETAYECLLFEMKEQEMRSITINFPLYQGVREVWIGLDDDAEVNASPKYKLNQPVVFYGTSITQGGCASRPGIAYTNLLSRRLNLECINMGFSGNGRGESELAWVIADIENPACIVLDYEANANMGGLLEKTLPNFIKILRTSHPTVPLLIVSAIKFSSSAYMSESRENHQRLNDFQRTLVDTLRSNGDHNIYFFSGSDLLGNDFEECTVDGIHPNDLGFWRMALNIEPVLAGIIFGSYNNHS